MESLYFLFGAWLQIRSANLLDQILDFGGIGFWNFSLSNGLNYLAPLWQ